MLQCYYLRTWYKHTHPHTIYISGHITWCESNQRNQRASHSLCYPHWQNDITADSGTARIRFRILKITEYILFIIWEYCAWCLYKFLLAIWFNILLLLLQISSRRALTYKSNFQHLYPRVRCTVCASLPSNDSKMKDLQVLHLHSSDAPHTVLGNQRLRSCFMQKYYNFMNLLVNKSPSTLLLHQRIDNNETHIHTLPSLKILSEGAITNPKKKLSVSLIILHWIYWSKSINSKNFHCKMNEHK